LIRQWRPVVTTLAMVSVGMTFMFEWNPVVHHSASWAIGSDLWNTLRAAHFVSWGFPGGIYQANGIITFPGTAVLLAPVAMLSGALHLSESFMPYTLARPTAALVLEPVALLLAATVVFATDALADRIGVGPRPRSVLCVLVGVIAWLTAAVWGHPEESLAMTFAFYAMVAFLGGKWARCGWLFGAGVVLQPLVALMLPLFIAATPRGGRLWLVVRSSAASVVLVGLAAAGDARDTFRALVEQPTPPSLNHPTPWVYLSPKLSTGGGNHLTQYPSVSDIHGHLAVTHTTAMSSYLVFVAGGPGRMIDALLAVLFGLYIWRRPQSVLWLLWLAAVVLASRCFFEPVMTPYYLAPPLLLGLVLAARASRARFWAAAALALEVTVFSYYHLNPWFWWSTVVLGLAGVLGLAVPAAEESEVKEERRAPLLAACLEDPTDHSIAPLLPRTDLERVETAPI
jgi:hypothetical protein